MHCCVYCADDCCTARATHNLRAGQLQFEKAFAGGMSTDGALPPSTDLAATDMPLYPAAYYEGQFSTAGYRWANPRASSSSSYYS